MHVKQRRGEGWHKVNNPPEYLGQVGQTRLSKHNKNHNHSHFSRNNIEFRKKTHLGNKASGFNLVMFKASWLPCWTVRPVVGTCLVFRKCTNNIWADWRKVQNLKDGYCPESEPTVLSVPYGHTKDHQFCIFSARLAHSCGPQTDRTWASKATVPLDSVKYTQNMATKA